VAKLLGYNFEIIYKPGQENKGADALSRSKEGLELNSMIYIPVWLGYQALIKVHDSDKWKKIIPKLQRGTKAYLGFTYKQGVLLFKDILVIDEKSSWIPKLFEDISLDLSPAYHC